MDNNEIDPRSEKPPDKGKLDRWQAQFRDKFQRAAKRRGLEGETVITFGLVIDGVFTDFATLPNEVSTSTGGAPLQLGNTGLLGLGTAHPGDTIPDPWGWRPWTVLRNEVIEPWPDLRKFQAEKLCAKIIRLIRTDLAVVGSELPTIPEGFKGGPGDLEGVEAPKWRPIELRWVAKHLCNLAHGWGDWGPIPWSELCLGAADTEDLARDIALLRLLQDRKLVRIEKCDGYIHRIHFLPAFERALLSASRRKKAPPG